MHVSFCSSLYYLFFQIEADYLNIKYFKTYKTVLELRRDGFKTYVTEI
jgi:hypothetical protein